MDLRRWGKRAAFPAALVPLLLIGCATASLPEPEPLYVRLSASDAALAARTVQTALETGAQAALFAWENPKTGHAGSVRPLRTWLTTRGMPCRAYAEELRIGGETAVYRHVACRGDDGIWTWPTLADGSGGASG